MAEPSSFAVSRPPGDATGSRWNILCGVAVSILVGSAVLSHAEVAKELAPVGPAISMQMTCPLPGIDTDGDGHCDDADDDDDNDGMPDTFELANRLDPLSADDALGDLDLDEFTNLAEFRSGTNPDNAGSMPGAQTSTFTVASVLPLSRSAQVGTTVTAFATLLNASQTNLTGCYIVPSAPLPARFFFNATDPLTNASLGDANTPIDVVGNGSQSFIFGFTPNAAFSAREVLLRFACDNANPVAALPGVNTISVSASVSPVPDIVALVATAGTPGVLSIPDIGSPGAFSVASINLGAEDTISVTAGNQNGAQLPLVYSACETNPADGSCVNPLVPAASVSVTVAANSTPTFSVFVSANGEVALNPGASRIAVTFTDSSGEVRGSTSVAVEAIAPQQAPTFSEVQSIFTTNCALSGCHNAASQRAGMSLEAPAFANIVGVASSEQPALRRINPGNPDASYLVRKIQGTATISGSRMPFGRTPLSATQIDLIRAWVAAGAAND